LQCQLPVYLLWPPAPAANILSQSSWEEDLIKAKLYLSKPPRAAGDVKLIAGIISDARGVVVGEIDGSTMMAKLVVVKEEPRSHARSNWTTVGLQASKEDQALAMKARALQDSCSAHGCAVPHCQTLALPSWCFRQFHLL